jgi:hypothetical protein
MLSDAARRYKFHFDDEHRGTSFGVPHIVVRYPILDS